MRPGAGLRSLTANGHGCVRSKKWEYRDRGERDRSRSSTRGVASWTHKFQVEFTLQGREDITLQGRGGCYPLGQGGRYPLGQEEEGCEGLLSHASVPTLDFGTDMSSDLE